MTNESATDAAVAEEYDETIEETLPGLMKGVERKIIGQIIMYSIIGCPHCIAAKHILTEYGLTFIDIPLDNYQDSVRTDMAFQTGGKTSVPQIFFNDVHVGGFNDLRKLIKGNLDEFNRLITILETYETPVTAPGVPADTLLLPAAPVMPIEFDVENGVADELVIVINQLKKTCLIKDYSPIFGGGKKSFKARDLVEWLMSTKQITEEHAMDIGQSMLDGLFFKATSGDSEVFDIARYYRLLADNHPKALNITQDVPSNMPLRVGELANLIRDKLQVVFDKHVKKNLVNYAKIATDDDWVGFVKLTYQLQRVDMLQSERHHVLSLFINLYNAIIIHGFSSIGIPNNSWARKRFMNSVCYVVGGESYNPYQIINGVLRANSKGNGMFTRAFSKTDMRLEVALNEPEPLALFALNCGARGCPDLRAYSAESIDEELADAAAAFIETDRGVHINKETKSFEMSEIFKWYKDDFGERLEHTILWVSSHAKDGDKKTNLFEMMDGQMFVQHMSFDWTLNDVKNAIPSEV